MANCMFGYPIHSDNANAALSAGSWEAALPLTNLADRRLAKVARSTDATTASTKFDVDLGAVRYIHAVALIGHNLSLAATVRIYADDNGGFASPDYDSTALPAIPDIYPSDMPQWEVVASRDGALSQEDYDAGYVPDFIHICPSPQTERYWRIEIVDTANADGYVQIGRLVIVSVYQPILNMDYGAGLGWQTSSTSAETDGGATYHVDRKRRRIFNFVLPWVSDDEGLVHGFRLQQALGTSEQLLFVFDPADTVHLHRRSMLCTLESLSPLVMPYLKEFEQAVSLVEEL